MSLLIKTPTTSLTIEAEVSTLNKNKDIALKLLIQGVAKFDRDYISRSVAPEYRQHNPVVEDRKVGLLKFIDTLESQGTKITIKPFRILAEGDLVMIHQQAQVDSENLVAIDLFKISNNQITEHWDVLQKEIIDTDKEINMTNGAIKIMDLNKTEQNKQLVTEFVSDVFINSNQAHINRYIDSNYIDHSPFVSDGQQGLEGFLNRLIQNDTSLKYTKTYNTLAEGNFVYTQSEGVFANIATALSDIWRIEGGKIVEHWSVTQAIPEHYAHDNGMF